VPFSGALGAGDELKAIAVLTALGAVGVTAEGKDLHLLNGQVVEHSIVRCQRNGANDDVV